MLELRCDLHEGRRRFVHLPGVELDLKGTPSVVRRLDHRVKVIPVVVLVMIQVSLHRLCVYLKVPKNKRLKEKPKCPQVSQQHLRRNSKQGRGQRRIAEPPLSLLLDAGRGSCERRERPRVADKEQTVEGSYVVRHSVNAQAGVVNFGDVVAYRVRAGRRRFVPRKRPKAFEHLHGIAFDSVKLLDIDLHDVSDVVAGNEQCLRTTFVESSGPTSTHHEFNEFVGSGECPEYIEAEEEDVSDDSEEAKE